MGNVKQEQDILNIAYAGTVYKWHPIESFFNVISQFNQDNPNVLRINFYGVNIEKEIKTLTKEYSLESIVKIHPRLSNKDLLVELMRNNILLLFNDYSVLGTKIYDYLAVKRQLLFCYCNDKEAQNLKEIFYNLDEHLSSLYHLQEDLIKTTDSGILVENSEHLYSVLEQLKTEFKEKKEIKSSSKGLEQYSRRIQVEKLAILLQNI